MFWPYGRGVNFFLTKRRLRRGRVYTFHILYKICVRSCKKNHSMKCSDTEVSAFFGFGFHVIWNDDCPVATFNMQHDDKRFLSRKIWPWALFLAHYSSEIFFYGSSETITRYFKTLSRTLVYGWMPSARMHLTRAQAWEWWSLTPRTWPAGTTWLSTAPSSPWVTTLSGGWYQHFLIRSAQ